MPNLTLDRARLHLQCLDLPAIEIDRFIERLRRWLDNSGPEWTVERLKLLKDSFVGSLSRDDRGYPLPSYWAQRRNRKGKLIVKDPLVHRVLSLKNTKFNLRVKENFFRLYTVIKLSRVSEKQERKMIEAVTSASKATMDVSLSSARIATLAVVRPATVQMRAECRWIGSKCESLPEMLGNSKRSPTVTYERRFGTRKLFGPIFGNCSRQEVACAEWRNLLMYDSSLNDLWRSHTTDVSTCMGYGETFPLQYEGQDFDALPAGRISVIQEGGAKARWIANPFLPLQALGEPLKKKLQQFTLAAYPEVFVHNQDGARSVVVDWLLSGEKVWSYDCTSFTDRFPVTLQLKVLDNLRQEGIVSDFDIDVFKTVVDKEWLYRDRLVRWEVGQPLGFGPSFSLATLSHASMLANLALMVKADPQSFLVVGDDVVIKGEALAHAYFSEMSALGVSINQGKSLISDIYAEFLGKLMTKDGVNPSIKVKMLESESQFHKAFSFYGVGSISRLADPVVPLVSGLFIPSDLGGDDLRPPGIKLSDWISITDQDFFAQRRLEEVLCVFSGGLVPSGDQKHRAMQLRSDYFKANMPMSLSIGNWRSLLGREIRTLNRWTGFPTNDLRDFAVTERNVLQRGCFNTFTHIQDTIASFDATSFSASAYLLEQRFGYTINSNEKPFTANHLRTPYVVREPERASTSNGKGRKFLKKRKAVERWLKLQEARTDQSFKEVKLFVRRYFQREPHRDL